MYRAKEVLVKTSKEMIINIDGELIENNKDKDLVFKIEDYKLPVITGQK